MSTRSGFRTFTCAAGHESSAPQRLTLHRCPHCVDGAPCTAGFTSERDGNVAALVIVVPKRKELAHAH